MRPVMVVSVNEIRVIDPGWAWAKGASFSPAVSVGEAIYVSGQLALDADGRLVGAGSVEAQARRIFQNIGEILRAANASLSDVVRLTCYCTDFADYGAYSRVRAETFAGRFPASTTVGISSLLVPGALLEVDAIAMAPTSRKSRGATFRGSLSREVGSKPKGA